MKKLQPHRKMFLAWKKNKGIKLTAEDLDMLFRDDAMLMAAQGGFDNGNDGLYTKPCDVDIYTFKLENKPKL